MNYSAAAPFYKVGEYVRKIGGNEIGRIINVLDSKKLGRETMTVYVIEFDEARHLILPGYAFEVINAIHLPEDLFEI